VTARALALALVLAWPLQAFDDAGRAFALHARRPALEPAMHALSDDARPALLVAGAVAFVSGPAGRAALGEAGIVLVPVNLVVESLKRLVDRPRPGGSRNRSNASFPSSHAANAFAIAFVLARRWPRGSPFFVLLAAAVAWSRMDLDRHWCSDVIAGALLGLGLAWAALALWRRRQARPAST